MRPPILFVRHGETDWNREARLQGRRDIHLNALGRRQAERNGRVLAPLVDLDIWAFVASPLVRAGDTMRIILAECGCPDRPFATDERLLEVTYGSWEGLTLDEVSAADESALAAREAAKWTFVPPGGESYAMLAKRVAPWLQELDRPTLVVAHGGVMRALMHFVAGMPAERAAHLPVPQDRVVLFKPGLAAII